MSKSWGRIRIRNWIGIITESRIRIRIDIEAMPIHNNYFLCDLLVIIFLLWSLLLSPTVSLSFPIQYALSDTLYIERSIYLNRKLVPVYWGVSWVFLCVTVFTYFFLFSEYYAAFCRKLQVQSRQRLQRRGLCGGGSTYSRTQVRIYYFLPLMCVYLDCFIA
jgi:hypothetical protein